MTAWGREILVLWRRVAGKFEYGDWKVQGPVHGEYAVTDGKGEVVCTTTDRDVAKVIACLPQLCDTDLRGVNGPVIREEISGAVQNHPEPGVR